MIRCEAERCQREIEQAEAAVRERCGFGDYLWLQDWREELEQIRQATAGESGGTVPAESSVNV